MTTETDGRKSQYDKFKEAARTIGADEDEMCWGDRLRNVAKVKLQPEKPE